MKKTYTKKDIVNKIEMIVQSRLDEVSGMVKPKSEKEAILYLLRRFRHVFTDFGSAVNQLNPQVLLDELAPGSFEKSSLSSYLLPSKTIRTSVPGSTVGMSYKEISMPFYKIVLNISPSLKTPFAVKTFIDKNDAQFKQVGPDIKSIISKSNKIYEQIEKYFSGYPTETQTSLKGILNRMRRISKGYERRRERDVNILIENIFSKIISPSFIKKYTTDPSQDLLSDVDLREILIDAPNHYLPFEQSNQSIHNFQNLVKTEIKNKLKPLYDNIDHGHIKLRPTDKRKFQEREKILFGIINKFIGQDGSEFKYMNSQLLNYLGDYNDIDSSPEGTYLFNYKEIVSLKNDFEKTTNQLENILNERYKTESYREQESVERFSTVISLYEFYSQKLYGLLTEQVEKSIKSMSFTLEDIKTEESLDKKIEQIQSELYRIITSVLREKNKADSEMDASKQELKKQITDFYIKSGSSYADISDPTSRLGKKLKMVDDLGDKFSELETEFFDQTNGVVVKFIMSAFEKLIGITENETVDKVLKEKLEAQFETLTKDGKNVVFDKFQKKLNQFIEYYRSNYNKRYESTGFELAPDFIIQYGENKFLKLEKEIAEFLASSSLQMRNLLPRNLYIDFTKEFLRKPKERD
jgi:hypothetical protein